MALKNCSEASSPETFQHALAVVERLARTIASTGGSVLPEVLDMREVGNMLGTTVKTVRKMDRRGALPEPIVIGSRRKWRVEELRAWLAAGAPGREKWRAITQR